MFSRDSVPSSRGSAAGPVAAGSLGLLLFAVPCPAQTGGVAPAARAGAATDAIRPFRTEIPGKTLADLRRRIAETRWPDRETVTDRSQGARLESIRKLAHYRGTEYDWRKVEARLNALPQFVTSINGFDIHFIHVRSRHPDALPLIITHGPTGWPGPGR